MTDDTRSPSTSHGDLTIAPVNDDQLREFCAAVSYNFHDEPSPEQLEADTQRLRGQRTHGIFADQTLLGGGAMLAVNMTMPGAGPQPIAAVSEVGLRPDHTGKGGLRGLMRAQLELLHSTGAEPVAALWASEAGIYGRFGYGMASRTCELTVPTSLDLPAQLTAEDARPDEPVRLADFETALPQMRECYQEYQHQTVGAIDRLDVVWQHRFRNTDLLRDPANTRYRFAIHPRGYAAFHIQHRSEDGLPASRLVLKELIAADPAARLALWRHLLSTPLVRTIRWRPAPADEVLPLAASNPRAVQMSIRDGLFVRIVDLPRAMAHRRYRADCSLVIALTDSYCPWNAGTWRLEISDGRVQAAEPSSHSPDLETDVQTLAASYLGAISVRELAAAGRVREHAAGAVGELADAMSWPGSPYCPEVF